MSKLKETQRKEKSLPANRGKDTRLEAWTDRKNPAEAAEILESLGDMPELDYLEPSEELYQKIIGEAKARGLLDVNGQSRIEEQLNREKELDSKVKFNNIGRLDKLELKNNLQLSSKEPLTEQKMLNGKIQLNNENEISNEKQLNKEKMPDIKQSSYTEPENKDMDNPYPISEEITKKKKFHHFTLAQKTFMWTSLVTIAMCGLFGVTMSSEANRANLMNRVDAVFGNDVNNKVNNTTDVIISDTTEEEDKEIIENTLGVKMPTFFYMPDNMEYKGYFMDEEAGTAYLEYAKDNIVFDMAVMVNSDIASTIFRSDRGERLPDVSSELADVTAEIWKIEEENDELPTYLLQWDYNNCYYRFSGKVTQDEIVEMAENIMY